MSYRVALEQFEGPLDLLLFFIRRDELDIYDIPIARIADEFLAYVRVMEEINLDGVGDFLYTAALLISIKVKLLFPRPPAAEDEPPEDPRRELVERLLEYMRYKEATEELHSLRDDRSQRHTRPSVWSLQHQNMDRAEVYANTTVFDLVSALRRILADAPEQPTHAVRAVFYTIEEQQTYVMRILEVKSSAAFAWLVGRKSKSFIIATFLAVLELARAGRVALLATAPDDFQLLLPDLAPDGHTVSAQAA